MNTINKSMKSLNKSRRLNFTSAIAMKTDDVGSTALFTFAVKENPYSDNIYSIK